MQLYGRGRCIQVLSHNSTSGIPDLPFQQLSHVSSTLAVFKAHSPQFFIRHKCLASTHVSPWLGLKKFQCRFVFTGWRSARLGNVVSLRKNVLSKSTCMLRLEELTEFLLCHQDRCIARFQAFLARCSLSTIACIRVHHRRDRRTWACSQCTWRLALYVHDLRDQLWQVQFIGRTVTTCSRRAALIMSSLLHRKSLGRAVSRLWMGYAFLLREVVGLMTHEATLQQ